MKLAKLIKSFIIVFWILYVRVRCDGNVLCAFLFCESWRMVVGIVYKSGDMFVLFRSRCGSAEQRRSGETIFFFRQSFRSLKTKKPFVTAHVSYIMYFLYIMYSRRPRRHMQLCRFTRSRFSPGNGYFGCQQRSSSAKIERCKVETDGHKKRIVRLNR